MKRDVSKKLLSGSFWGPKVWRDSFFELQSENMSTEEFFASLDQAFLNFDDKSHNPPLLFKSTDCYLSREFVLPIPVLSGSTVKYQFSTTGGDVEFSAKFAWDNDKEETVFLATRVPSDMEPYKGSFKAPKEGSLLLRFDNSFSWFTSKLLSYQIELYQPAFTMADSNRCIKSRSLLMTTVSDTQRAEKALETSQQQLQQLNQEIPTLESRLASMMAELERKKQRLEKAYADAEELSARIEANMDKRNGLCIRVLTKALLQRTLQFLGPESSVRATCKYWHALLPRPSPVSGTELNSN